MTKEERIYYGEMTVSSINGIGNTRQLPLLFFLYVFERWGENQISKRVILESQSRR